MTKYKLKTIFDQEDLAFLRTRSEEVSFPLSNDQLELINALKEYTLNAYGLGMSAVQLGVHDRIFVMRGDNPIKISKNPESFVVVVNPKILEYMGPTIKDPEGCFSFYDKKEEASLGAWVARPSIVKVEYYDQLGHKYTDKIFDGVHARIFQHEFDHLNGDLMHDEPRFVKWYI